MRDQITEPREAWNAFIIAFGEALYLDRVLNWLSRRLGVD